MIRADECTEACATSSARTVLWMRARVCVDGGVAVEARAFVLVCHVFCDVVWCGAVTEACHCDVV
jgi:hypothetical protein